MSKIPSTIGVAVIAFAMLCIVVVGGLIWHGNDPGPLITFIGTLVPLTIGVVVVASKVDKVQETADNVHKQVNGRLDAKFQALHDELSKLALPEQRGKHSAESADNDLTAP